MTKEAITKTINECFNFPKSENIPKAVMTGFNELDNITGGFKQGDLIIIGSRPSMGKTAFALNIAQNIINKENKAVVIFSLEMSKEQFVKRLLSSATEIECSKIHSGNLTLEEYGKVANSIIDMAEQNLFIDDKPSVNVAHIKEQLIQLYLNKKEVELIIIDYLQLMGKEEMVPDRIEQIESSLRDLKKMAREFNLPIIVLSQLSRAIENRLDKHPLLTDLRDSGSMANYANAVMFLYREDYYNPECSEKRGTAEIIVAKNSNGDTGTATLLFNKEIVKFRNIEKICLT